MGCACTDCCMAWGLSPTRHVVDHFGGRHTCTALDILLEEPVMLSCQAVIVRRYHVTAQLCGMHVSMSMTHTVYHDLVLGKQTHAAGSMQHDQPGSLDSVP